MSMNKGEPIDMYYYIVIYLTSYHKKRQSLSFIISDIALPVSYPYIAKNYREFFLHLTSTVKVMYHHSTTFYFTFFLQNRL